MKLIEFIQLILRNKKWVFAFPLITGITVFFLTRNMPHTYSSEMVIYTGIASGYNIDNEVEGKIDYHEVNSKFDNLINTITAKETRKDVALHLLAKLINNPDTLKRTLANLKLDKLKFLSDSVAIAKLRGADEEATFGKLLVQVQEGSNNEYYQLLNGTLENPFNLNTLNSIKATRLGFSDMVKVEYTSEDAFITKTTLDLLAEVFLNKYRGMRNGEVNGVVKYFEGQTQQALERLEKEELSLKNFRTTNRVINFYEQTKYIADQKEDYEKRESQIQMDLQGYLSALAKVEKKLNNRALIQLKSDLVVKARNELSSQYNSMGISLVKGENIDEAQNAKVEELKKNLKDNIQGLYELNNSTEGVPGKNLLDQWLELTVSVEESTSKLNVLERTKADFEKIYDQFAPMGSDLSKLERGVDVAEKEYLNLLHNLNQAKLRDRNSEVTENISITDPPDMPAVPNSSKRSLLVIVGALSCFIIVLVILVLKEFMDDSISNPLRFLKLSGIKTATAFAKETKDSSINLEELNAKSYERWMLSLIGLQNQNVKRPLTVLAIPFHKYNKDFKEMLGNLSEQMQLQGNNWRVQDLTNQELTEENQILFANSANRELISNDIIGKCDMIYIFINAAQKIDEYQQELLDKWKLLNIPISAVMVDTKIHHLDKFIGEIPKKRSRLRKRIKDIVRRYS